MSMEKVQYVPAKVSSLLPYWQLPTKTLAAPVLGSLIFGASLIAASGNSFAGYLFAIAWFLLALFVGVVFSSWRVVGTAAILYGASAMFFLSSDVVAASLLLGFATHALYALTKCRCLTIGCCNFYAYGRFGRTTRMRRFTLQRIDIAASLILALVCTLGLYSDANASLFLGFGIVAHGVLRAVCWRMRHHPSNKTMRGGETLISAVLAQTMMFTLTLG